jgi:hypothetical protein
MSFRRAKEIAANIEQATTIDVFENGRTLPVVDVRALFCYILRIDLKYKLVDIRDIIREYRPYYHATVLYNVKLYGTDVRYRRPDLEELRVQLINQYSPYFTMLKKVNALTDETLMKEIIKLIDDYESTQQKRVDLCDESCD